MDQIIVVLAPQLGVNDLEAVVSCWRVPDGGTVTAGSALLDLETTKATFEVEAEASGFVVQVVEAGAQVKVNQPVALVGPDLAALRQRKAEYLRPAAQAPAGGSEIRATDKARALAQSLGIELAAVRGNGIIREADVLAHQAGRQNGDRAELPADFNANGRPAAAIYGSGKGGVTVKECLELGGAWQPVCFVDDSPKQDQVAGLPVYHSSMLEELLQRGVRALALAVGNAPVRLRIRDRCDGMGMELINAIHPRAYIAPSARVGRGNYIKAGALIDSHTRVGDCCIIDNGAIIPHDNVVGDGCHIAPGAVMGGFCTIGDRAIVGIGASISASVKIGRGAILSVGCAVTRDVPEGAVVEGSPARIIGSRTGAAAAEPRA